ncbi:Sugar or nucleoside kinase, ribokinase family [Oceanobacillus limi]|uniref:Sugar or nucleoside kinase, ribokinase family n=1 Tax=Oceanobacillus limi TaxID=930131 RepID=A0A1I0F860_9BACI|nr:PfkB family carbohydrate kinase [Oceanobacillus limi]SET53461.1 Sugar or nucleoside kinase, ribokinase family [Oceanobacillus limi]
MTENKWEQLNHNEQSVIRLIKSDPFISQQELAGKLELSRPSVANLISGLVKKGYIRGKAYILNEENPVICIGGANVDRKFYINGEVKFATSNPVHSTQNAGGVARNIGENLGRLGKEVILVTAGGSDAEWTFIEQASSPYMNVDYVAKFTKEATGSYTAVLDRSGELVIALADMDIYEQITPDILKNLAPQMSQAACLMVDLNCPKEALNYLIEFSRNQSIPVVFVAVSAPKMERLPEDLNGLTWLITNRDETEAYFSIELKSNDQWRQAVEKWLSHGVENVVITNGAKGVMIGNDSEGIYHIPAIELEEIVDVTGAGDAFSSAIIYAWLDGKSLPDSAKAGIANAAKTLQSPFTVRQNLSSDQLFKDMEELS